MAAEQALAQLREFKTVTDNWKLCNNQPSSSQIDNMEQLEKLHLPLNSPPLPRKELSNEVHPVGRRKAQKATNDFVNESEAMEYKKLHNVNLINMEQYLDNKIADSKTTVRESERSNLNSLQIGDSETKYMSEYDKKCMDEAVHKVKSLFAHPKGVLNNVYSVVVAEKNDGKYTVTTNARLLRSMMWEVIVKVRWPVEQSFIGLGKTKQHAGNDVAYRVLAWLYMQNKLLPSGHPVLYSKEEVKEMVDNWKQPIDITIVDKDLKDVKLLMDRYEQSIAPELEEDTLSEEGSVTGSVSEDGSLGDEYLTDPITGKSYRDISERYLSKRSADLLETYRQRIRSFEDGEINNPFTAYMTEKDLRKLRETQESLPIFKYKSHLTKLVNEHPVVVITGETGCGKSTQVPQIIFDNWTTAEKGAWCNIIVTQPRRISAISLAERVSQERLEQLGDTVGYQVRLKSNIPQKRGAILFCSAGILLRRMQGNPSLIGASHIVLDEAHERDINTDMLLVLLKRAVKENPSLKVIIMSATVNYKLFSDFFDRAPIVHVPGFTYPVKQHFLADISEEVRETSSSILQRCGSLSYHHFEDSSFRNMPFVDTDLAARFIAWIDLCRPEGAILCFLPGWQEIKNVADILKKQLSPSTHWVLPVHSRLSFSDQRKIFQVPPPGIRKIILATNIAETSITINDVVYVVDLGVQKEQRFDPERGISSIVNQWVSKSNVHQRKGRAGRVRPGESFHLFSRKSFLKFEDFPSPEVLRVPLETTVLECKTHSETTPAVDFLSQMPEPPPTEAIKQAVDDLIEIGALDMNENLTPLGRRISYFTMHPKLSKALVHACIFRCVSPMLSIAATLSSDREPFDITLDQKDELRAVKSKYSSSSDHLALANLYEEWERHYIEEPSEVDRFCARTFLHYKGMLTLKGVRRLFAGHLYECFMLQDSDGYENLDSPCNMYRGNDEMVKGVFFSGMDNLLRVRSYEMQQGRIRKKKVLLTEEGSHAAFTGDSVNFKRTDFTSQFLTCFRQIRSEERRLILVRETSLISPLSIFLFTGGKVNSRRYTYREDQGPKEVVVFDFPKKKGVRFTCEAEVADQLIRFRKCLWDLIDFFVEKTGNHETSEQYMIVESFHQDLLRVLSNILHVREGASGYLEGRK